MCQMLKMSRKTASGDDVHDIHAKQMDRLAVVQEGGETWIQRVKYYRRVEPHRDCHMCKFIYFCIYRDTTFNAMSNSLEGSSALNFYYSSPLRAKIQVTSIAMIQFSVPYIVAVKCILYFNI